MNCEKLQLHKEKHQLETKVTATTCNKLAILLPFDGCFSDGDWVCNHSQSVVVLKTALVCQE